MVEYVSNTTNETQPNPVGKSMYPDAQKSGVPAAASALATSHTVFLFSRVHRGKVCPDSRVAIQLAKKPLEKPLEISYTGKTQKMGSLDMSQNQIWICRQFISQYSVRFVLTK